MLDISVRFLCGEFVAQTYSLGSEWPPHPVRLLYALIGAWHDGGCDRAEGDVLGWLEAQEAPAIVATRDAPEETYEAWLPMNSVPNWNKRAGKRPSLPKTRQRRSSRFVGDAIISFVWDVDLPAKYAIPLRNLCRRCTRLGSSESMVGMSVEKRKDLHVPAWRPSTSGTMLRIPMPGVVQSLSGLGAIIPGRMLPCDWQAYRWGFDRRPGRMITVALAHGHWPVERAPRLAWQLRRALIAVAEVEHLPLLPILHGHEEDGSPLRRSHLHFCPLPHVGSRYASGAVLGVSFIMPANTDRPDREYVERLVSAWFATGGHLTMEGGRLLSFGPSDSRHTLTDQRWCRAARVWQTVVPMELPRHVAKCRRWNRDDWRRIAEEIRRACSHAGLPPPTEVEASNTPFAIGSPNARAVRGPHRRPVVHARLLFPDALAGPVVVGAGRHLGYGLMEPVETLP